MDKTGQVKNGSIPWRKLVTKATTYCAMVFLAWPAFAQSVMFEIDDGGGVILNSPGNAAAPLQAGYSVLEYSGSDLATAGFAIISLESNGVLKSELVLPAVEATTSGRIYIDDNSAAVTAIVIANPDSASADVSFYFSDDNNTEINTGGFELESNEQIIAFLDGFPFGLTDSLAGTLTLSSSVPIAISAIRILVNETGDSLLTAIPVAPTTSVDTSTAYLPIYIQGIGMDGDEITSTAVLVNPTDSILAGQVIVDKLDGQSAPFFNYVIQPRSMWRSSDYDMPTEAELPANFLSDLITGSARIVPNMGNETPEGFILLSDFFDPDPGIGRTASEVTLGSVAQGTAFRFFVENIDFANPDETLTYSFNITDVSGQANSLMFELMQLDGTLLLPAEMVPLDASNGIQTTLGEVFNMPSSFSGGILRISSSQQIIAKGLRSRTNADGEPKLMAIPGVVEGSGSFPNTAYFPLAAEADGFSTEFFIFSAHPNSTGPGSLTSYAANGNTLDLGVSERSLPITANLLLTDSYRIVAADGSSTTLTTATFHGTGSGTTSFVESFSGSESSGSPGVSLIYTAAQNYRLGLILDVGGDEQTFEGIISFNEGSILLISSDDEPSLLIAHRQGTAVSPAALNGEYIAGAANGETSSLLVFNFDGVGAGTFGVTYDLLEGEPPSVETVPFTYTVTGDGRVNLSIEEGGDEQELVGAMTADGSSLSLVEITDPSTLFITAYRTGSPFIQSDLNGKYVAGALIGTTTTSFVLEFDGAGNGSIQLEDSLGNTTAVLYDFTFDLEADGQLNLSVDPGEGAGSLPFRGVLSEDRSQLVLVVATGAEPIQIIAMKAPEP